jgi:anti-anti-sigma regulatory factor
MEFSREVAEDGTVMLLRGAFTFKDHHSFRALLDQLKTSPSGRRVLDLSHLEFLDSAALGMLLIADDEAKSGGWAADQRNRQVDRARMHG